MKKQWTPEAYRLQTESFLKRLPDHQDCIDFIGFPPEEVVQCYGMHGLRATCSVCGWNCCIHCKNFATVWCVKCNDKNCAGCLSEKKYRGWSGCCDPCVRKGLKAPLPRPAEPKKEEPKKQEEPVIIVDDDDETLCSGVHLREDVCSVCGCNCCRHCQKPRRAGTR